MKKKGNKKMPTPRHKLIHNPIPTSLFLSSPQCISYSQFNVVFSLPNAFTTNKQNSEQRCRDGVMNEFVSWCRHLLVSFLFRALTSLQPPSFHRNDFSTCYTTFTLHPEVLLFRLTRAYRKYLWLMAHLLRALAKTALQAW